MPEPKPSDLLGSVEAAALIGIERSTITRWIDKGWIKPALRLSSNNGAMLFRRSEVMRASSLYEARQAEAAAGRAS